MALRYVDTEVTTNRVERWIFLFIKHLFPVLDEEIGPNIKFVLYLNHDLLLRLMTNRTT